MTAKESQSSNSLLRWIVPSLGSILTLTALVNALFFRREHMFRWDGDVGRHIRVGRTILERSEIPRMDLWSHTKAGDPFVPYEWLSEALTALVDVWAGLPGVAAMSAVLYVIAILATYRSARLLGAPGLLAFLTGTLAILVTSVHLLPRPHLFTTALAGVFLVVLLRHARSGAAWDLAPLPLLMLFWANVHGGFLIGFILLVAFLAAAALRSNEFSGPAAATRHLAVVTVLCVVASLANPAGIALWAHTTGYLGIDFLVGATQEYQSIDFHTAFGKLFFIALFAGPVLWMTGRVRVTWLGAALFLFFAASSLHSARNAPLFAVIVLPWLARWAAEVMRSAHSDRAVRLRKKMTQWDAADRLLRPGLATVFAAGLVATALEAPGGFEFDPAEFPVDYLRTLEAPPGERVFNQMNYGGYLLYARRDIPVFIDGQTDFYGEELSQDYLRILKGRVGWREALDRHGIDWTLTHSAEPINELLALDPDWELDPASGPSVVYRRR